METFLSTYWMLFSEGAADKGEHGNVLQRYHVFSWWHRSLVGVRSLKCRVSCEVVCWKAGTLELPFLACFGGLLFWL